MTSTGCVDRGGAEEAEEQVVEGAAAAAAEQLAPMEEEQEDGQGSALVDEEEAKATQELWDLVAQADACANAATLAEAVLVLCSGGAVTPGGKRRPRAQVSFQDDATGTSLLMMAAGKGLGKVVEVLLEHGAPWNALDRQGRCAGEYALDAGHAEVANQLLTAGVRAELVLGAIESRILGGGPARNKDYLENDVEYTQDGERLMDTQGEAVMMEWERPLMKLHAQVLCQGGLDAPQPASGEAAATATSKPRDILNVGFGMGIVDSYIQEFGVGRHVIIEAHPEVHKRMLAEGWDKKPGVEIFFGRWQDVIARVGSFDGVFFDTFGEFDSDMKLFHSHLTQLVRPGGLYSFFNGLCPRNAFFQNVACEVVGLELEALGLETQFFPCDIQCDDKAWAQVRRNRRYYFKDRYYLPVARR